MPSRKPKLKVMKEVSKEQIDTQQVAEETGHKPVSEKTPEVKKAKMPTLTLGEKTGVYFGSREIWTTIFGKFGLSAGKLVVEDISFDESSTPEKVVARLTLSKPAA